MWASLFLQLYCVSLLSNKLHICILFEHEANWAISHPKDSQGPFHPIPHPVCPHPISRQMLVYVLSCKLFAFLDFHRTGIMKLPLVSLVWLLPLANLFADPPWGCVELHCFAFLFLNSKPLHGYSSGCSPCPYCGTCASFPVWAGHKAAMNIHIPTASLILEDISTFWSKMQISLNALILCLMFTHSIAQ